MSELKHERLRGQLLAMIAQDLRSHEQLPTEREIAASFGVSRVTVRRTFQQLQVERRIYRIQGAGTFVAEPVIAKTLELTSFSQDMRQRGLQPGSRLLLSEVISAGDEIGYALGLRPADPVIHMERLRTADGSPMCIDNSYLPSSLFPGLIANFHDGSLYELLENTYGTRADWADQTLRATVLAGGEAKLLDAPAFSSAFVVERTTHDERGRPIERGVSLYRGDRYSFQLRTGRGGIPTRLDQSTTVDPEFESFAEEH